MHLLPPDRQARCWGNSVILVFFSQLIITKTLSRTVKGQVMLLKMRAMIKLTSSGTFLVSPSMVVFVNDWEMFGRFDQVRLVMSIRK